MKYEVATRGDGLGIPDEVVLGPLTLRYEPDGDDPGVGRLVAELASGLRVASENGEMTSIEWAEVWGSCWP